MTARGASETRSYLASTREENASRTALTLIETAGFDAYALIDSGAGRKLERFGTVVVDRPELQALWQPRLPAREWAKAHAVFSASADDEEKGKWRIDRPVPESWPVRIPLVGIPPTALGSPPTPDPSPQGGGGSAARTTTSPSPLVGEGWGGGESGTDVTMLCKLQGLWHLGLFPEQMPHWHWTLGRLAEVKDRPPRVLNLFAYTGAASLLAAATGAEVTHVDASKKAIQWAKENQAASKLERAPIRWMLDDAVKFAAREVRRGRTYHMILIDPPKFGRGPEGEVWDLFAHLPGLLQSCVQLLAVPQASVVLTAYAIRASALALDQLAREALRERGGTFLSGELAIRAEGGGNAIPTSLFTRWTSQ